jgi:hypothetical protein
MKKHSIITAVLFSMMSLCSYGQTVVWTESFEPSSGITSTACTRTSVNTLANTDCIPDNWKTGRLASSGTNQGHRWRASGNWPMPGYGSYALDLDPQAAEGGGLLSHGATLTAGISYTLTFYYRIPGGSGGGTYKIFVGHTTNGNQSSNPTYEAASSGNTNSNWNLATYSFTPSTTGTYYMQIYARNTTAPTQRLLIDNMTLTQACTPPAQPSNITGNITLCNGVTQTYSVTNDPDATSYTWTLPSGWTGTSTTNSISVTAGTTGGTVSVVATNTCGNSTAQTTSITVTNVSNTVTQNGNTLTANEAGATYQWIDCTTGTDIQNETGKSFTPTADGSYSVRVTKGGCNATSTCIVVNTLGVNATDLVAGVRIFPNPATELVTIQLNSLIEIGQSIIQVTDLTGRVVLNQTIQVQQGENTFVLDTDKLPQGIYSVDLLNDTKMLSTQKLIISK